VHRRIRDRLVGSYGPWPGSRSWSRDAGGLRDERGVRWWLDVERPNPGCLLRPGVAGAVCGRKPGAGSSDPFRVAVAINGDVWATNPATGQREYPCLISLNVDRGIFDELVLEDVRPDVCLRHLRALVSPHPY